MALEAIIGALEAIEPYGIIIALAGSISGTAALVKSAVVFKKTRDFKAYMAKERSRNEESLGGVMRVCRDIIDKAIAAPDGETYFRSLSAISLTLQTSLFRYEEHIAHDARRQVPVLLRQLLDASTVGRPHSIKMLRAASLQIKTLLDSVVSPPADPR